MFLCKPSELCLSPSALPFDLKPAQPSARKNTLSIDHEPHYSQLKGQANVLHQKISQTVHSVIVVLVGYLACALCTNAVNAQAPSPAPTSQNTKGKPATSLSIEGVVFEPKTVQLLENPVQPPLSNGAIVTPPNVLPAPTMPAGLTATGNLSNSSNPTQTGTRLTTDNQSAVSGLQLQPEDTLWDRMRKGFSMPNLETPLAQDKTQWYARQPDYIARMVDRGGQYLFHIVGELERRGMPTELALLPFVESAFNPQAVSSAKAAGMWQFMPATGKHFNLKQNVWRDERRGVVESTRAALDYLQKLHGMFGDWHLALAAYNWGEGSVQRAINKNRAKGLSTEYTALKMPNETAHYVPKFQAVKNIIQHPENYGIALAPLVNAPFFASVVKERDIDVSLAAKFAGMSLNEFKALNPGFKKPVILGANRPEILLPASKLSDFNIALNNYTGALSSWTTVTLSGTEQPAVFAKRYGISELVLRDVNNIPPRMLIKPGSTLVVPKRDPSAHTENISAKLDDAQLNLSPELVRRGLVAHKGDTWTKMAKRAGVSVTSLREWNRSIASEPKPGTRITFYTAGGGKTKKSKMKSRAASKKSTANPRKASKKRHS